MSERVAEEQELRGFETFCIFLSRSPALTNPLVLYSVPKCGPLRLRKVCKRGRSGRNCGRVRALRMMMVPKECPMKLTFAGFRPDVSMWCRISPTSRSVIVSKSENVSPYRKKRNHVE